MPFGLGIWELAILGGLAVLLFGAKGVPQMARRLGGGVRELKDAVAEVDPRRMLEAPAEPKAQPPARPGAPGRAPSAPRPTDDPPAG